MPAGIAVGTLAIGPAGATNAAIMAAQILGLTRPDIAKNVADFRAAQTEKVASKNIPGHKAKLKTGHTLWIKPSVFLVVVNSAV